MDNKQFSILILLLIVVAFGVFFIHESTSGSPIFSQLGLGNLLHTASTFEECAAAGNPIMESYPRQCRTKNGKTFTEDVGNVVVKQNLIHVSSPLPNEEIKSPLVVEGEARGNWFFEASFPVKLLDENGNEIAKGSAQAQGEWMTTNFVPFKVTLTFKTSTTKTGILVLEKDNPSGDPNRNDSLRLPIKFKSTTSVSTDRHAFDGCVISGCSSQICSDKEVISTCEYKAEYQCYRAARCERQAYNQCGWTRDSLLKQCLANAR